MTVKHRFYRRGIETVLAVCAFFFLFPVLLYAEKTSEIRDDSWNRLWARSECYLKSLDGQASQHAQSLVKKGLARLAHPVDLVRKPSSAPIDYSMIGRALQRLDGVQNKQAVLKAAEFVGRRFHQPSKWDIAVQAALPSQYAWECRFGLFTAQTFGGFRSAGTCFIPIGCAEMTVVPTTPRDPKSSALLLGFDTPAFSLSDRDAELCLFVRNDGLLSGFPSIARTIVLRI